MRKQGVGAGAMLLASAGIIVKIIGALFKVPLGVLLGPEGMANFSIAYNIYALLFVISTAGIPTAMSKMIAEENASGHGDVAKRILKTALAAFSVIGCLASVVLFLGAVFFASAMGNIYAADAIKAIAPAIFFVAIASILRGYYQGHQDMIPTAISEIIEASGKLLIGLSVAYFMMKKGASAHLVAAGAVLGVTAGAVLSAFFLLFKEHAALTSKIASHQWRGILRKLFKTAIPITLGASVISLSNVIDSAIIMRLLQNNGYSLDESMWLFGAYNYATTIFNLPGVVITTLGASLLPALTVASAKHDEAYVLHAIEATHKISVIVAACAGFSLYSLGAPIMYLLYGGSVEVSAIEASGKMLSLISLSIPMLAMSSLSAAALQALGDVKAPMYSMALGAAAKIICNLLLVGVRCVNIYGACIGTIVCYMIIAVKNALRLKNHMRISISYTKILFKPILIGLLTGASSRIIMDVLKNAISFKVAVVLAVFGGVFVCFSATLLLKGVTKSDINMLFGDKIITIFSKNNKK